MMKNVVFLIGIFLGIQLAQAQVVDFDSEAYSQQFKEDFQIYSKAYSEPVISSYSYNLISGWNQTAKVLQPWAVRLEFIGGATQNPDQNRFFDFNTQGFSNNIRLKNPENNQLPTALGGATDQAFIYSVDGQVGQGGIVLQQITVEQEIPVFDGVTTPGNSVPNAVPQLSLGLPLGTEVSARFFPYFQYNGATHNEFGLGVKHGLDQHISAIPDFLHWNVAALFNGSRYNYEPNQFLDGEDQDVRLSGSAFMLHSTFSADYKFVSFFVNAGYYNWTTRFSILGTYRYTVEEGVYNGEEVFEVIDPVEIIEKAGGVQASAGLRFVIAKTLTLSSAYHIANKNTLTFGLGFRFGKEA